MPKKWIFLTGLLLCLVTAVWLYRSYYKPRAGVQNVASVYELDAAKLYEDFVTNEAAANARYNGKVLAVTGKIADIQQEDSALLIVLEGTNGGGVSCSFATPLPKKLPAIHTTSTIKGRCTGFLMDVNLVDAILID